MLAARELYSLNCLLLAKQIFYLCSCSQKNRSARHAREGSQRPFVTANGLFKSAGWAKENGWRFREPLMSEHTLDSLCKNKTNKLNHKQRSSRAFYYVCLFVFSFMCLSHTSCLVVFFLTEQPVFKAPIFATYSTNICNHLYQVATFIKRPQPPLCNPWFAFLVTFNCVN